MTTSACSLVTLDFQSCSIVSLQTLPDHQAVSNQSQHVSAYGIRKPSAALCHQSQVLYHMNVSQMRCGTVIQTNGLRTDQLLVDVIWYHHCEPLRPRAAMKSEQKKKRKTQNALAEAALPSTTQH